MTSCMDERPNRPVMVQFKIGYISVQLRIRMHRQFFFAPFRLDAVNRELFRNEQRIVLRPKTYAVLLYLVEHAGRLVEKDELLKAIWPDSETIDTSLKVCIRELRVIFGDDKDNPQWIETRQRIGYRFVATVTRGSTVDFEVEDWDGMRRRGFSVADTTQIFYQLDFQNLEGLTESSAGTLDQWVQVSENNPEGRAYLLADGQPVGYWHFEFVDPELYEHIRAGQMEETELTADKVCRAILPGRYNIYIVCFLIDKGFRVLPARRLLYESFINRAAELRSKGIEIDRVCTNAFTPEGVSLCRSFGLREVCQHKTDGVIYEGRLSEHPRFS
jgi:DNA-binding winged helix-turn-helix (wHTH) protein